MDIQKTILTPFNRSLGNGAAMGELFALAVDHVILERDTTVIVKLINAAKDKKDSQAERAIRSTFAAIFDASCIAANNVAGLYPRFKRLFAALI